MGLQRVEAKKGESLTALCQRLGVALDRVGRLFRKLDSDETVSKFDLQDLVLWDGKALFEDNELKGKLTFPYKGDLKVSSLLRPLELYLLSGSNTVNLSIRGKPMTEGYHVLEVQGDPEEEEEARRRKRSRQQIEDEVEEEDEEMSEESSESISLEPAPKRPRRAAAAKADEKIKGAENGGEDEDEVMGEADEEIVEGKPDTTHDKTPLPNTALAVEGSWPRMAWNLFLTKALSDEAFAEDDFVRIKWETHAEVSDDSFGLAYSEPINNAIAALREKKWKSPKKSSAEKKKVVQWVSEDGDARLLYLEESHEKEASQMAIGFEITSEKLGLILYATLANNNGDVGGGIWSSAVNFLPEYLDLGLSPLWTETLAPSQVLQRLVEVVGKFSSEDD